MKTTATPSPEMMRTTVTLSPEMAGLLDQYVSYFAARLGSRVSTSTVIEEALGIALPMMFERVPEKGESPREFLDRRAKDLKNRLSKDDLTEPEALALMREANRCQDECRSLLLSNGRGSSMEQVNEYQECLRAFMSAYNAGAERLNKGTIVPKRKKN